MSLYRFLSQSPHHHLYRSSTGRIILLIVAPVGVLCGGALWPRVSTNTPWVFAKTPGVCHDA
jgi:hypothetical protein